MRNYIHFPADTGSPVTLVLGALRAHLGVLETLTVPVAGTDFDVRSRGSGTVNHRAFGVLSEMAGTVPDMYGDVVFFVHKGQLDQAKQIIKDASKINPWTGWDWVVLRDSPSFMEALDELTSRLALVEEPDPLVQLLEDHQRVFGYRDGGLHCACGWVSPGAGGHRDANAINQLSDFAELRSHMAAMIREALVEDGWPAINPTPEQGQPTTIPIPAAFTLGVDVAMVSPKGGATRGTITGLTATRATVTFRAPRVPVYRQFVVPKDHPGQGVLLVEWVSSDHEEEHGLILAPRQ